jgi:hypothetical protein
MYTAQQFFFLDFAHEHPFHDTHARTARVCVCVVCVCVRACVVRECVVCVYVMFREWLVEGDASEA